MTNPVAKRVYDFCLAAVGLVILSPVFLVIALLVNLGDSGPVFFRQERVGLGGRLFWMWKFRTMVVNAERQGIALTKDRDVRITRVGRWLRKSKLDELPQLWNVLVGEMTLVGPRPEVPRYVARYTEAQRAVLKMKPGVTDLASLEFRNEEELLATASDVETFYMEHCLPRKIELNLEYQSRASLWQDTRIIGKTLLGFSGKGTGRI